MTTLAPVALHPEAGAVPEEVRWIVAAAALPPAGTVVEAPGALGALLADGILVR